MKKWTWNLVFLLAISLLLVACSSTDDEVTTEEATIKVGQWAHITHSLMKTKPAN